MADINSYALSIELTLQSNAQEVLKGVTDEISGIETKVKNLIDNMSRSMDAVSSGIKVASKDMSASVRSIDNAIRSTDMGSPAAELADSVEKVAESASSLSSRSRELDAAISDVSKTATTAGADLSGAASKFSLPVEELENIRKAMTLASDVDFMLDEQEYVDEATKQYKFLTDDIMPKLLDQRSEMKMQGQELGDVELKVLYAIEEIERRMVRQRTNAGRLFNRLRKKWAENTGKELKSEGISRARLILLSKGQREEYERLTEAMKSRARVSAALGTAEEMPTFKNQEAEIQATQDFSKSAGKLKETFGHLGNAVKKITAGFGNMMKTMGYGQLAEATSVTGMYGAAVGKAAEEEEKFHTINFRAVGTMRSMQTAVRDLSIQFPGLRSEFIDSTIALREMGGTKDDIKDLVPTIAALGRTTGASVDALAKFAKTQTVVSGSTAKARKELLMMQRGAKEMGLTGKDLDTILSRASDSAFLMGSKGSVYAQKYNMMLLKAAGAAKRLGLSTEDATAFVDRMKDPLEAVRILGRDAFTMDPKKRMEAMGKSAKAFYNQFTQMAESEEKYGKGREIQARFGIKSYGDIEKQLRLMFETAETGEDALNKGIKKPQEEINDALKDSAGLQRDTAVVMEKTMSKLQKTMEPVLKFMESINEKLAGSPVATTLLSWGAIAGSVGSIFTGFLGIVKDIGLAVLSLGAMKGSLSGLIKGGLNLSGAWKTVLGTGTKLKGMFSGLGGKSIGLVTKGFGLLKTGAGSLATKLGTVAVSGGLAKGAMLLLGKGALVAGSAIAGWKIGRWVDDLTGFGDSLERVNKGTGDWWDKMKVYSNPIGWMGTATNRLTKWWNGVDEAAENAFKEERARKYGKSWKEMGDGVTDKLKELNEKWRKTGDQKVAKQIEKITSDILKKENAEYHKTAEYKEIKMKQELEMQKKINDEKRKADNKKQTQELEKQARTWHLNKDQAEIYLGLIKKHKTGTDEHKKAVEEVAEALGTKTEGLEQKLGNVIKGVEQKPMEEAEKKLQEAAQKAKDAISKAEGPEAKAMEKQKQAAVFGTSVGQVEEKLDQLTKATETKGEVVTPETLTTSKITDDTARPTTEEDRKLVAATKNNVLLEDLARRVDKTGNLEDLMRLLKDYLPKIADKDTGLASTANQWV